MTLDEAIKHCEEKANEYGCCDDCRIEHKQLADWLKELKALKEKYNVQKYTTVMNYTHWIVTFVIV